MQVAPVPVISAAASDSLKADIHLGRVRMLAFNRVRACGATRLW
jgi:hypothetical protein